MNNLLIISYDAVGDHKFESLLKWPNFAKLASKSSIARGVSSVDLTNTYPVHTSVITGTPPESHGIISNKEPFPKKNAQWCYRASEIKAKTLWQAAYEKGLSVGSVLWPVTGGAKEIRWNIPEILTLPGESQIVQNLKYGSKIFQLVSFLRHHKLMNGIHQPELDKFSTACMVDLLQKKHPNLALMHLTAYDSLCHENGYDPSSLNKAMASLDESLGKLLAAISKEYNVLLFSDHSQLAVEHLILPNELLVECGYLKKDTSGNYIDWNCFFDCCGGCGFFYPGSLNDSDIKKIQEKIAEMPGFNRFLTDKEMKVCGRKELPFGFCAKPGWSIDVYHSNERANHGYPSNYDQYKVFFLCTGPSFAEKAKQNGGSLLDIAPLVAKVLNLNMPNISKPNLSFLR